MCDASEPHAAVFDIGMRWGVALMMEKTPKA